MDQSIFRGYVAIAFAISNLLWGLAGAVMIFLGGAPVETQAGQYVLSNHGYLTNVSRNIWFVAHACDQLVLTGWILMLLCFMLLLLRKVRYPEVDPGRDCSILAAAAMVVSVLLQLVAAGYSTPR
jgi:hypothetical protein